MPEIVIIGGGLSGLAAAWELEQAQINYALIEVKPRLGGSIVTQARAGWLIDDGPFVFEQYHPWEFLPELGLTHALEPLGSYRDGQLVIFRQGTQVLVEALAERITSQVMLRMAVSGLGKIGADHFGVCLENGVLLEARGVVVAVPAHRAEQIFRTLLPQAALFLSDFRYDPVVRVSLGYRLQDTPADASVRTGGLIKFVEAYHLDSRMPAEHSLVRLGVRLGVEAAVQDVPSALAAARGLFSAAPVIESAHYWPEADPLTCYVPEFAKELHALEAELPSAIALVGSDYHARRLDDQVRQGRAAARRVLAAVRKAM